MSGLVIRKKESVSLPTCECQFDLSHHEGDCNAFGDELAYLSVSIPFLTFRICKTCQVEITEGYCINDGEEYFCNDHEPEYFANLFKYSEDTESFNTYWTQWEDDKEDSTLNRELCYDCAMYYKTRGWKVIRIQ